MRGRYIDPKQRQLCLGSPPMWRQARAHMIATMSPTSPASKTRAAFSGTSSRGVQLTNVHQAQVEQRALQEKEVKANSVRTPTSPPTARTGKRSERRHSDLRQVLAVLERSVHLNLRARASADTRAQTSKLVQRLKPEEAVDDSRNFTCRITRLHRHHHLSHGFYFLYV